MICRRFACLMICVIALGVLKPERLCAESADRPNVLFIFLDDYGWKDCGFMGSDFYETPNLDKLAAGGMIFTNAYSCSANCAPARACLLSGQYTPRHEVYNVGTARRGKPAWGKLQHVPGTDTLRPDIKTWAKCIQEAGYKTASMGKWHLSDDPVPYGFDVNVGGSHSGSPPRGYFPPHGKVTGLSARPDDEYLTDYLHDTAIDFMSENKNRPWFLYLTHFAVHTPLQAKSEIVEKYRNKKKGEIHNHEVMAAMIESVDQGVGRLVQTLADTGQTENTMIVFFSDNGGYGPATSMAPLKGYKGCYYEGGIREPFFVNWPGKVKPGSLCDEPIIGVDMYPTFCEVTGAKLPEQPVDGVSIASLLTGRTDTLADRALFWHFPAYLQSYARTNEQRDPLFRARPCSIIRHGDWKLHEFFEDNELELYNLKDDIGESTNLAATHPDKARELHKELIDWRAKIDAPVPTELNPNYDAEVEAAAIRKVMDGGGRKGKKRK